MSTQLTTSFRVSTEAGAQVEIEVRVRSSEQRLASALLDVSHRAARHAVAFAIEEGGLGTCGTPVAAAPFDAPDRDRIFKGKTNEH